MPYPFDSGAQTPGTSLGVHVANGADTTGLFTRLTGQIILEDARQYHLGSHTAHTDVPNHNFTSNNEYGAVTSYPTIVPFNTGWFSLQSIELAETVDLHYSGVTSYIWRATAIGPNGNILWQRNLTPADLDIPQVDPPITQVLPAGRYADCIAIAGNNANKVLLMTVYNTIDTEFRVLTFDGSGNFTVGTTWTSPYVTPWSYAYVKRDQILCGSGMIAFSNITLTTGSRIMCLDANLELVGYLASPGLESGYYNSHIVPVWNGVTKPHYVQTGSGGTGPWKATPINFDGVSAPSWGTPTTGTAGTETVFMNPHSNGFFSLNDWNTGSGPKPENFWFGEDGTPHTTAPNPENVETVYSNDWYNSEVGNVSFDLTVPTDWYGAHDITSVYDGADRWGSSNYILRVNVGNNADGVAGVMDLVPQYPEGPVATFTGVGWMPADFLGYWDADMDDAGYVVPNGYNDRVLIWTYHYWQLWGGPPYTQTGWDYGENRLSSYWIFQAGGAAPPAQVPGWVDVFGSTGGGTKPSGNGPCIDCGMLGVGNHRAFLYDRGGTRKIAEITDSTMIRWSRVRDDISSATIIVNSPRPECCAVLSNIAVGRHEIVIYRDQDRVWEGPITRVNWKATSVEITAHDICHYLSRTIMHHAYDNRWRKYNSRVGPVTHRAQAIIKNELIRKEQLSAPVNIVRFLDVRTDAATTKTSRFTYPYQSTVWEEIDYMAQRLSLDYTTLGRRLILFDTHYALSRLQMLTDKDFSDELIVSSYGMELATISAVTDGEGHWASVGGIDGFYGEVELLNTTYGEGVQPENPDAPTKAELAAMAAEMTSQAQRNLSGRYPIPTVVRVPDGTQLSPAAPVCINELIPGVRIPIRSTLACLTMEQEQKLDKVVVEQTRSGETVSITLSPAPGTTPWDDSSESSPGDDGADDG